MVFTLLDILWLLLIGAGLWFWWNALGAHQRALRAAKQHCEQMNVQLLDDSVVLQRLRIQRSTRGPMTLARSYQFEFSSTGDDRYFGEVKLLGYRLQQVHLGVYRI